jgi:hypothetical protein
VRALIYDLEIKKAVLKKGDTPFPGIEYCKGWDDHANMGISVICALETQRMIPHVFIDRPRDFQTLARGLDIPLIGFNSINFDDLVMAANDAALTTDYDLLEEVRVATDQPRKYGKGTRKGYTLNDLALANLGIEKSNNGGDAPILWQRGQIDELVSYCMRDVMILFQLLTMATEFPGHLADPNGGKSFTLPVAPPKVSNRVPALSAEELEATLKADTTSNENEFPMTMR